MRPSTSLTLFAAHVTSALAPLPNTCASYPSYNPTTLTAGPFHLTAIPSSPAAPINGTSASLVSFTNDGKDRYGFLTIPLVNPNFAAPAPKTSFRCVPPSTLQAQLSVERDEWVDVSIAGAENWQGALAFGLQEEGVEVRPYKRGNGTGVWLGAGAEGMWAFKHNWGGNAGEYFLVRWVGGEEGMGKRQEGPVVDDRDWVGGLRVE